MKFIDIKNVGLLLTHIQKGFGKGFRKSFSLGKKGSIRLYCFLSLLILFVICAYIFWPKNATFTSLEAFFAYNEKKMHYFRISDALEYKPLGGSIAPLQPFTELAKIYPSWIGPATSYQEANFIMFETLNKIDILMQKIVFPVATKYIFGLRGSDLIASKSLLAMTLKRAGHGSLMPRTYVTEGGSDKAAFLKDFGTGNNNNNNDLYILKKNVQRQEGFVITGDKSVLIDAFEPNSGFVVCQELLQDPLVITGLDGVARKINLRVYILIIVDENVNANASASNASIYMYDDGFVYYTADAWKPGSSDPGPNITTGYVDRQVYVDNPLTTQDLYAFLAHANANVNAGELLRSNMINALVKLAKTYAPIFWSNNNTYPGKKFLVYGCDVAPSANMDVRIMEVNKGPDLGYKDDRDKALKLGMMQDAMEIVGLLPLSPLSPLSPSRTNQFVKLV
jgi:hypothetical protein